MLKQKSSCLTAALAKNEMSSLAVAGTSFTKLKDKYGTHAFECNLKSVSMELDPPLCTLQKLCKRIVAQQETREKS